MSESDGRLGSGFVSEAQLEEALRKPSAAARRELSALQGDILVLGAGGKMGPTLSRLLARASGRAVTAVSRFSEPGLERRLQAAGIRTLCADLPDRGVLHRERVPLRAGDWARRRRERPP
ncbi:MAG: hypothetical protein JW820_09110 [Spirochaetales bacterium]|nr:hypothetical protein [Spirochaetales bacterium]